MARKIAILFSLFIVFYLGAHFWIRWKNRIQVDTIKTSSLIECEPHQVRGLKVLQREAAAEQMIVFERTDNPEPGLPPAAQLAQAEWSESTPAMGEADSASLNRLASLVCELYDPIPQRPEEMVESSAPERRAQRLEVSVAKGEKLERHEIDFGQVGRDRLNVIRYRSGKGERTVKIPPQLLQLLSRPAKDFLNLRVLRSTADNIQHALVSFDGKERFTLERAGADWNISSAGKTIKPSEEVERYLNRLSTLKALEAKPGVAADCQKKPHKVSLELSLVGGKKEFVGFDFGKSGDVSACNGSRAASFRVHRDLVKHLDLVGK